MITTITLTTLAIGVGAWILRRSLQQRTQDRVDAEGHARIVRSIAAADYADYRRRRTDKKYDDDEHQIDARRGIQWSPRRPPVSRGQREH